LKKIIFISILLILYGIGTAFYANYLFKEKKEASYIKLSHQLKNELNNEKRFSKDIGIINAISIAENVNIKQALLTNNRELAIKALQKMEQNFADKTSIKHLKVHIHTKNTRAFVRSWKLDKFVKRFKRKDYSCLLLIDTSLLKIAKYLKDAPEIGPYILSSKEYDKVFLNTSQKIDFALLHQNGYFISKTLEILLLVYTF